MCGLLWAVGLEVRGIVGAVDIVSGLIIWIVSKEASWAMACIEVATETGTTNTERETYTTPGLRAMIHGCCVEREKWCAKDGETTIGGVVPVDIVIILLQLCVLIICSSICFVF